ncbi:hypothetical protein E0Z06_02710 [Rheinheimera sp. D18]|uniref:GDSL-type esterase/lipase family protein n=1 Tax=Rheinheimera sp. D18 TaxID=2545632 RepID=UPI0010531BF3|nr:GDSL-type esterase/lipase family protein [Rheinheimera sp. D18]QBL08500.1 hypothetical protein E0Z06_02710 [Rheinheimera sp. D18]
MSKKLVFLFIVTLLLGYTWGALSITHNIFPKPQLREILALVTETPAQEKHNDEWQTQVNLHQQSKHDATIAIVGDSISHRGDWVDLLDRSDVDNRGINGDTSTLILQRIDSVYKKHYAVYLLMFGINDFFREASVDDVFTNYQSIISKLTHNNAKVIVQSTLYCAPEKAPFGCHDINIKIAKLNQKLQQLNMANVSYIDINAVLSPSGTLNTEFTNDGIHLNLTGYEKWAEFINQTMLKRHN